MQTHMAYVCTYVGTYLHVGGLRSAALLLPFGLQFIDRRSRRRALWPGRMGSELAA